MNWKQLYASAAPQERLDILIMMIKDAEARQRRFIVAGWWIIRNRRRKDWRGHRVGGDRRSSIPQWRRALIKTLRQISIASSVGALTGGVVTLALSLEPIQSVAVILTYEIALISLFYLRPLFKRLHAKATEMSVKYETHMDNMVRF
jgi:hypothetical protein